MFLNKFEITPFDCSCVMFIIYVGMHANSVINFIFNSYTMYYENLLRVHHTLLYTKEQVVYTWYINTPLY